MTDGLLENGVATLILPFNGAQRMIGKWLGAKNVPRDPAFVNSRGEAAATLRVVRKPGAQRALWLAAEYVPGGTYPAMFIDYKERFELRDRRDALVLGMVLNTRDLEVSDAGGAVVGLVDNNTPDGHRELIGAVYRPTAEPRYHRPDEDRLLSFVQPTPLRPVNLVVSQDGREVARIAEPRQRQLRLTITQPVGHEELLVGLLCAVAMPTWYYIPSRRSGSGM